MIRGIPRRDIRDCLIRVQDELGGGRNTTYAITASGLGLPLREWVVSLTNIWLLLRGLMRGLPLFVRLPAARARVNVKNNLRISYQGLPSDEWRSLKAGLKTSVRSGVMAREIRVRRLLSVGAPDLAVPRLLGYDRGSLLWFKEGFVERGREKKAEKMRAFLAEFATGLYGPFARSRPVGAYLSRAGVAWSEIEAVYREADRELPSTIQTATWTCSLIHGDLSTGNMMVDRDGRLFVIDWEKAHIGPIAWDLRKLALHDIARIADLIGTICQPEDLIAAAQIRTALALDLVLWRRGALDGAALRVRRGISQRRVEEKLRKRESEILDAIRTNIA